MSWYYFIATNKELPEVDYTSTKYITVQEAIDLGIKPHDFMPWESMDPDSHILFAESQEDLHELVISNETAYDDYGYSSQPFIYEINFAYSKKRLQQLLAYLQENIKKDQIVELWRIWLDDKSNIPYTRCSYDELTLDHLMSLYKLDGHRFNEQKCLVIER